MKLKPYWNIETENLKPLLFAARGMAITGYCLLGMSIIVFLPMFLSSSFNGAGLGLTMLGQRISYSFAFILVGFGIVGISGILAAVVSLEHTYTKTTD